MAYLKVKLTNSQQKMAGNRENPAKDTSYYLLVLPNAGKDITLYKEIVHSNLCFDGTIVESQVDQDKYEIKGEGRTFLDNLPLLVHGWKKGPLINLYVYRLSDETIQGKEQRPLRGCFQEHFSHEFLGEISDGQGISAATRCYMISIPHHNPADFLK